MSREVTRSSADRVDAAMLCGLSIVALEPLMAAGLSWWALAGLDPAVRLGARLIISWIAAIAIVVIATRWERRGWSSFGVRSLKLIDLAYAAGALVAASSVVYLTMPVVAGLGMETLEWGVRELSMFPVWLRASAAITAGITEEILFRGFLVERLAILTGRLRVGALLSWALFTALHVPFWGVGGALQIGAVSVIIYAVYVRRRSILPCVLFHVANDLYAFLLVPLFLPEFP